MVYQHGLTFPHWFSLDAGSPTTTVISTGNLQPLSSDLNIILCIIEDLHASIAHVVFCPSIPLQFVSLLTRVTRFCKQSGIKGLLLRTTDTPKLTRK